jgi:hypothetical protein
MVTTIAGVQVVRRPGQVIPAGTCRAGPRPGSPRPQASGAGRPTDDDSPADRHGHGSSPVTPGRRATVTRRDREQDS